MTCSPRPHPIAYTTMWSFRCSRVGGQRSYGALRWEHVHLEPRTDVVPPVPPHVEVWRSTRTDGDTKTRRSRRTLALPGRCIEALRKQRAQQVADRLAAGERWQETGLVFTTSIGTKMAAGNVRRDFRSTLRLVPGLDPSEWTPRELRHSFVSVLSDAGVPVEEISRLVGHSGTTVTEFVYRHQLKPVIQTGANSDGPAVRAEVRRCRRLPVWLPCTAMRPSM